MLARRRRRQQEKNKQKSIEAAAREIVELELETWRERVMEARSETETKRRHYRHQEDELRRIYEKSCQQLDQRRDTLLATTSLIPYTQTIQAASSFRVPAALLTLQARLCLHVHCLCVHEELLLKTKEQGWDTIAWMEDVSRQLRMLTQKQILLLQVKMQEKVTLLQERNHGVEIPLSIQNTLQQRAMLEKGPREETQKQASVSAEQAQQQQALPDKGKEESFLEFLQRYEQRKAHQQKADQMRLAEFRSRGSSPLSSSAGTSTDNPYTSRRAGVGKKLKNYASKLFQGGGGSNHSGGMDESLHLDDLQSTHIMTTSNDNNGTHPSTINEEASDMNVTGGSVPSGRHSWIPFVRRQQSESNLDTNMDTGWSLGSSLRGLRKRGLRKPIPVEMETQAEVGETGSVNGEQESLSGSVQENGSGDEQTAHHEKAANEDPASNDKDGGNDKDGDNAVDAPTTNGDDINNHHDERDGRKRPTPVSSPLKNKLKAPVMHKFFESANF